VNGVPCRAGGHRALQKRSGDLPHERLVDRFGVRRSNEKFWSVYDAINFRPPDLRRV
jgi:hypothetical protein